MSINIVLYQPEIPANTGNIARTCLATHTTLHLIHPLGFSTDDKMVRRAGLDYWKNVDIKQYDHIDELFIAYPTGEYYFVEDYGNKYYTQFDFQTGAKDYFFVFGRETSGIPLEILETHKERCMKVPMSNNVRSLNLSNTVAIVLYEVLRQQGFPNL